MESRRPNQPRSSSTVVVADDIHEREGPCSAFSYGNKFVVRHQPGLVIDFGGRGDKRRLGV